MDMKQLLARITVEPDKMGGVPCIRGMRIPVIVVLSQVAGYFIDLPGSPPEHHIKSDYPDLEREDIIAALLYANGAIDRDYQRARLQPAYLQQACWDAAAGAEITASPEQIHALAGNIAQAIQGEVWRLLDALELTAIKLDRAIEVLGSGVTSEWDAPDVPGEDSAPGGSAARAVNEAAALLKEYGRG